MSLDVAVCGGWSDPARHLPGASAPCDGGGCRCSGTSGGARGAAPRPPTKPLRDPRPPLDRSIWRPDRQRVRRLHQDDAGDLRNASRRQSIDAPATHGADMACEWHTKMVPTRASRPTGAGQTVRRAGLSRACPVPCKHRALVCPAEPPVVRRARTKGVGPVPELPLDVHGPRCLRRRREAARLCGVTASGCPRPSPNGESDTR